MGLISGLVDVLVPTYQHEQYIEECINSIFAQDYKKFIVHVFDDCSKDGTQDKLNELRLKWGSNLKVYRNLERQGSGSASILHQKPKLDGEFWALIEGDDYWVQNNKLTQQVAILRSVSRAVGVASKTEMRNLVSGEMNIIEPDVNEWNYFDLILNANKFRHYVHFSSILWRNSYQNTPFPNQYTNLKTMRGEVILMHEILKETKGTIILYDEITSVYRYTGKGIWSGLTEEQQFQLNMDLNAEIMSRRPAWVKIATRLGLSKLLNSKSLN
jgi:glycosyltransferase involved in cell wall biosynthesis